MRNIHFSVDDTIGVFEWLNNNKEMSQSIFDAPEFRVTKELHDKYGLSISFYCFYRKGSCLLSDISDQWREEFQENSNWLKVGFHGYDRNSHYNDASVLIRIECFLLTQIFLKKCIKVEDK